MQKAFKVCGLSKDFDVNELHDALKECYAEESNEAWISKYGDYIQYQEDDEQECDQADQYDQAENLFSMLHILTKQQDSLDYFRITFTQKLIKARQKDAILSTCTCALDDEDLKQGKLSESNWEIYLSAKLLEINVELRLDDGEIMHFTGTSSPGKFIILRKDEKFFIKHN